MIQDNKFTVCRQVPFPEYPATIQVINMRFALARELILSYHAVVAAGGKSQKRRIGERSSAQCRSE